jgi:hypothetical protein
VGRLQFGIHFRRLGTVKWRPPRESGQRNLYQRSGERITPMAASCAFESIARKARISTTRLHDLRHTAATALLLVGVDICTVAGILGHESLTITLSTYAHLMPETQRAAVDRLGERLERLADNSALVDRATERQPLHRKARKNGAVLVAPTGIEPANRSPGRSR